jgi:hypothetical protein
VNVIPKTDIDRLYLLTATDYPIYGFLMTIFNNMKNNLIFGTFISILIKIVLQNLKKYGIMKINKDLRVLLRFFKEEIR